VTTTLDQRAVAAIAEDLDRATAEALEWVLAEAGHDHAAIHRILSDVRHPIICNWDGATDFEVCEVVRKVETGVYLAGMGRGTFTDVHDLTVEDFNTAVLADPYAYLAAAAAAALTPDSGSRLAYSTSTERAAEEALAVSWPVPLTCSWCGHTTTAEADRVSPSDRAWVCGTCQDWG